MQVEAIVFDLGGTLIEYAGEYDSWPTLETPGFHAAYRVLHRHRLALPDEDRFRMTGFDLLPRRWSEAISGTRNLTVPDLLSEVLETFNLPVPGEAILAEAAERYQEAVTAGAEPIEHGREVVARFKAEGYRLGLISNTMWGGASHIADLERFGLAGYFDAMLFSADVNMWKPNPAPFRHILEQLGVPAYKAVFIGDDPAADVIGGNRAGLHTIHFVSSQRFGSPDGVSPAATIYSLSDLPKTVASLDGAGPQAAEEKSS
jgi:HAD superfamily hydrolase (TIGR01549 family)